MPQQQEDLDHNRETTNRYLREAIAYIQQHFSEGLRVSDLADHVAVSRGYLYQIFNETLGMSPKQYLTNFGMTRATELLTLDDQPVEEVSIRRQHFYEKQGFRANPWQHIHPPYRPGFRGHELVVITWPEGWTKERYDRFADYLKGTVMADCGEI